MAEVSKIRSWLQLMRIANLPTAISNIAAGYWLAHDQWDWVHFTTLAFWSGLLYCGGMILNDAFDADLDAVERPTRPIPSGAISRIAAFVAGFAMLLAPLTFVLANFVITGSLMQGTWVLTCLTVAILLYDWVLKKTCLAPVAMGACRTLNVLLGGSGGFLFAWNQQEFYCNLWSIGYAVSLGLFICGITLFARNESQQDQSRFSLSRAAVLMLLALLAMASLQWIPKVSGSYISAGIQLSETRKAYAVMIAMISLPIARRLWIAIRSTAPGDIGTAIVTSLNSLIFLDAAVCFLARPGQPLYAMLVAALIVPLMLLRKLSSQT